MSLKTRLAKRRFKTVTLADGTSVRLRSLLRSEQRQWQESTRDAAARQYSDDVLIAMCIVDDDGNQVISVEDALTGFFDQWDMSECQALLRACLELCYLTPQEPLADRVGAALKNSNRTSGNGSSGASPDVLESPATNCMSDSTTST